MFVSARQLLMAQLSTRGAPAAKDLVSARCPGRACQSTLLVGVSKTDEQLSTEPGRNPLVLATFRGRDTEAPRKRLLFYGHYDVQPASEENWESDPWELSGRNGYLYARGVSDNKGPILAVACAAAALRQRRELDVDLVMLIEGEEEAGSKGFAPAVRRHKVGPFLLCIVAYRWELMAGFDWSRRRSLTL
jgi:acetylornithine deacetylase/succinyl-diaminopimelate desuccinylase-like protein